MLQLQVVSLVFAASAMHTKQVTANGASIKDAPAATDQVKSCVWYTHHHGSTNSVNTSSFRRAKMAGGREHERERYGLATRDTQCTVCGCQQPRTPAASTLQAMQRSIAAMRHEPSMLPCAITCSLQTASKQALMGKTLQR
jgi:hypothetical protein